MLSLRNALLGSAGLLVIVTMLVGCSGQNASLPSDSKPASADWKAGLDEAVVEGLSELPDADRNAALAQKECPVTGKTLGSMGKPPKVTVQGQEVFLCCSGCEEEIKSKPDEYLAKLNKQE